jgi:hypothetical protein
LLRLVTEIREIERHPYSQYNVRAVPEYDPLVVFARLIRIMALKMRRRTREGSQQTAARLETRPVVKRARCSLGTRSGQVGQVRLIYSPKASAR